MLEIKSIQSKDEQKNICEKCGVEFIPDALAYDAKEHSSKENGVLLGVSQFRILGEYAVIYTLSNAIGINDTDALVIIGKTTLNFIDLCGVHDVVTHIKNTRLLELLEFKHDESDGLYRLNLTGYFDSPCQRRE